MEYFNLEEAQLYRLLVGLFGSDRVVPKMSLLAACGGLLPESIDDEDGELHTWAKGTKCLFTITDDDANPKLVVNFFSGFGMEIDPTEVEFQKYAPKMLEESGVRYISISEPDFEEILDPESELDIVKFFETKVYQRTQ
jgi:hypothetical protein